MLNNFLDWLRNLLGNTNEPSPVEIPPARFIPVEWKIKGSSHHPQVNSDGDLTGRVQEFGDTVILWIFLRIGDDTFLGTSGSPRPMWYFQVPDDLMPAFYTSENPDERGDSVECVGSLGVWTNDKGEQVGKIKWTKNTGSGKDGMFMVVDGVELGPTSHSWKSGDKIRATISYERG